MKPLLTGLLAFFAFCGTFVTPTPANASDDWLNWHSSNVQLLRGSGFELGERSQTVLTLEHVNDWKYGDNFVYVDFSLGHPEDTNAEFSPRLSLSKITGKDFSFGPVSDILFSTTFEKARRFDAYLWGVGVDLDIPGFDYVQANYYSRNNPDVAGTGWQTTWVWSKSFNVGDAKMKFEGYFDWADYEEGVDNFFTQPQLLLDVGEFVGLDEGRAYAGLEYYYWHNVFGVDGVTTQAPQAMLKVHF